MRSQTIRGACKINMRFMIDNQYIVRGKGCRGVLSWSLGSEVGFYSVFFEDDKYIQLSYTANGKSYDYKIFIDEVQSNLGIGTVLYFVCPESGLRCTTLYSAHREPLFVHRKHYEAKHKKRLYYPGQNVSNSDYFNAKYHAIKSDVERLEAKLNQPYKKTHYKGKLTKEHIKLIKLKDQLFYYDIKRAAELRSRLFWLS